MHRRWCRWTRSVQRRSCSISLSGKSGRARSPVCWLCQSEGFSVHRWYHYLCVPPIGQKGDEEGGLEVRRSIICQNQFWSEWRSAAGCLEGWSSLPLEWWTRPHPQGVVLAKSATGAKLVGCTNQGRSAGGYLASKTFVLKRPSGCEYYIHLPLDPLTVVFTSLA